MYLFVFPITAALVFLIIENVKIAFRKKHLSYSFNAGQGGTEDPPLRRDYHPAAEGGDRHGSHSQLRLKHDIGWRWRAAVVA